MIYSIRVYFVIFILIIISLFFAIFVDFVSASEVYFVHSDHLGSTSVVTDSSGEVVQSDYYYPFGSSRSPSLSIPDDSLPTTQDSQPPITEHQFTSQISDEDQTGLYYYNARYYNPQIAKFTQADTMKDGFNGYSYVANNPVNSIDPTGNMMWEGGGAGGYNGINKSGGFSGDDAYDPAAGGLNTINKENETSLLENLNQYGSLKSIRPLNHIQYLGKDWNIRKKMIVSTALLNELDKIAVNLNITPAQAYALIFGMKSGLRFTIKKGNIDCGVFAQEFNFDSIVLYDNKINWNWNDDRLIKLITHELGHGFDDTISYYLIQNEISLANSYSDLPGNAVSTMMKINPVYADEYWGGLKGDMVDYFRSSNNASEIFADMFLGWIFGTLDPTAQIFMNTRMDGWLKTIVDSQSQPQPVY